MDGELSAVISLLDQTLLPLDKQVLSPSGTYDPSLEHDSPPNVLFWTAMLIRCEAANRLVSRHVAEQGGEVSGTLAVSFGYSLNASDAHELSTAHERERPR